MPTAVQRRVLDCRLQVVKRQSHPNEKRTEAGYVIVQIFFKDSKPLASWIFHHVEHVVVGASETEAMGQMRSSRVTGHVLNGVRSEFAWVGRIRVIPYHHFAETSAYLLL